MLQKVGATGNVTGPGQPPYPDGLRKSRSLPLPQVHQLIVYHSFSSLSLWPFPASNLSLYAQSIKFGTGILLLPVQSALPDHIKETQEQHTHEYEHFNHAFSTQFPEIDRPGVHKDHLHVKQNKKDCNQEIFDGEGGPGISDRADPRFERGKFVNCTPFGTHQMRNDHGNTNKSKRHDTLNQNRQIAAR